MASDAEAAAPNTPEERSASGVSAPRSNASSASSVHPDAETPPKRRRTGPSRKQAGRSGTLAGESGEALTNTLKAISAGLADRRSQLQKQRKEMAAETIRLRNETRNTKKRHKRLLEKARNLDEEDLVEVLALKRVLLEERAEKQAALQEQAGTPEERSAP